MIEIGRAVSAKAIVKEAENSSIMSLLACYEELLLTDYGVLGVYVDSEDTLNSRFLDYMNYNSDNDGPKANSFSSVYKVKNTSVSGVYNLAESKALMHSLLESGKYTQAYAIAQEFLDISSWIDDLADKIGLKDLGSKINGIKDKLDKMAKVAEMIKNLKDVHKSINDVNKSIDDLGSALGSFVEALNAKKEFVQQYGENGGAPTKPDKEDRDNTEAIFEILNIINNNIDEDKDLNEEINEDAFKYLDSLNIKYKENIGNNTVTFTNEQVLNSLPLKEYDIKPTDTWSKKAVEDRLYLAKQVKDDKENEYQAEEEKYKTYNNEINAKNQAIEDARSGVIGAIENVKTSFNTYSSAFQAACKAVNDFMDDTENANSLSSVSDDIKVLSDFSVDFINEFNGYLGSVENGFERISGTSSVDDIIYTLRNKIGKGIIDFTIDNLKETIVNYLKGKVISWDTLNGIIKKLDDTKTWTGPNLFDMIKAVKTFVSVLKPWPDFNSGGNKTNMNDQNWNITLGKTKDSNNHNTSFASGDVADINKQINRGNEIAKKYTNVGSLKTQVSPNDPNSGNENSIMGSMISLGNSFKDLLANFGGIFSDGIMKAWDHIKNIVDNVKNIFGSILSICGQLLSFVLKSAYNNIMLIQYARTHFSYRKGDENDYNGNSTHQLFYKAEQEYIIAGSRNEAQNEQSVAIAIFTYRLFNNLAAVACDSGAMSLISACNFLAPVVYLIWVYYETCIDCNLLFEIKDAKIGLFKEKLWISVEALGDMCKNINEIKEDDTPEQALNKLIKDVNGGKYGYEEYLMFMMTLVSNANKTQRIGDLIQWHVRYKANNNFLLKNTYTMFRAKTEVALNPILPIINLSNSNETGISSLTKIEQVFYEGY